ARLDLFQRTDDLLLGELALAHCASPLMGRNSHYPRSCFRGGRQYEQAALLTAVTSTGEISGAIWRIGACIGRVLCTLGGPRLVQEPVVCRQACSTGDHGS